MTVLKLGQVIPRMGAMNMMVLSKTTWLSLSWELTTR
jgi:hypothetical protein